MRVEWWTGMGAILALTMVTGCSPKSSVTIVPVEGRVTLDGQPVRGCVVTFQPADAHAKTGPQAIGIPDNDGRFKLRTSGERAGAVIGVYRVFMVPGDDNAVIPQSATASQASLASALPIAIPGRYQSPATSGLDATVTADGHNSFVFDLRSGEE